MSVADYHLTIAGLIDRALRLREATGAASSIGGVYNNSPNVPNFFFVDQGNANASDTNDGRDPERPLTTIQKGVDKSTAGRGDIVFVMPGEYPETVTVNKAQLSIIGLGGRGACSIAPTVAGAEGMQVTANDVTLVNIGVAGDDTADYALNVHGNGTGKNGKRFRAYACKFEKPTGGTGVDCAVYLDGDADYNTADNWFIDCEFAWSKSGVLFDDSLYGFPTQQFFVDCWFHNNSTVHMGLATVGGVVNLVVKDCVFDDDEAGTAPTDYIKVDRAGDTGIITGCRFSIATNASADLKIAAGIMWVANGTEAGWSTARPA